MLDRVRIDPFESIESRGNPAARELAIRLGNDMEARETYLRTQVVQSEGEGVDRRLQAAAQSSDLKLAYDGLLSITSELRWSKPNDSRQMLTRLTEARLEQPEGPELLQRLESSTRSPR